MVVKSSKEFLQAALTNNSFDIDDTDKALRMALDHSFSYLYRLQRNMSCYEEYFYTTRNEIDERDYGDFFMDKHERICVNYPVALIHPQYREKYRVSKYYGTKIPYDTLAKEDLIFTRLPIITIDNQVMRGFEVEIKDDYISVHLGLDRYFLHTRKFINSRWEYEYISHTESVQVIDNSGMFDIETNIGMLKANSYTGYGFDRLKKSYIENFGVPISKPKDGIWFAVIFLGDDKFGSQLMEVDFDEHDDLNIAYPVDVIDKINHFIGKVTIRFYYYRYLRKVTSFRDDGYPIGKFIQTKVVDDVPMSDFFMVHNDQQLLHSHPVPTENFLIFKADNEPSLGQHASVSHFPNENLEIRYPNLYRIENEVAPGDKFHVYYFYIHPYELSYDHMYWFFGKYLTYRWPDLSLEAIINTTSEGDLTLIKDPDGTIPEKYQSLLKLAAAFHAREMCRKKMISDDFMGELYNYLVDLEPAESFENIKSEFIEIYEEASISSDAVIPEDYDRFAEVYDFVINHPIVDYFYDEMDYLKKYSEDTHPFDYKVNKLKSFIADDFNVLTNYVRAQNKVAMKYEYSTKDIDMAARYRTERMDGRPFKEPMYAFPIKKIDPDNLITARIWIDGLMCSTFALERYEYSDIFYVPAHYLTRDSYPKHPEETSYPEMDDKYIEIEIFYYYNASTVCEFTKDKPWVELDFPKKDFARPTMSDIFFSLGEKQSTDRIEKNKFEMEVVSGRYNYYVDDTPIQIYYGKCPHGDMEKGPYYDMDGHCYSFEGQPDSRKDISTTDLLDKITKGEVVQATGYLTDNHLKIVKLEDIVTYDRVFLGETTLQEDDNIGVLCSDVTRVKITLLDETLYDQPIMISVKKSPLFSGSKMHTISYPSFSKFMPNYQDVREYTRAFKNGRLISKNRYDFTDYFDGILGIQMLEQLKRDDTMGFDITPFRNRLVYFKEKLESDYINLRGYINKPFDPQFYEVYINGRRLNRTNLFPISPWEIRLAGLHSIWSLEIYEKDRDWEYYGIDFSNYYTFSDFIREPFIDEDIARKMIDDITGPVPPNDNCEDKLPWDKELDLISVYFEIFYYMKLIPMHFVTGDEKYPFSSEEIKKKWPIIYKLFRRVDVEGGEVLLLSPDDYYKPDDTGDDPIGGNDPVEGEDNDEERWRVYHLGNIVVDDLDDDTPEEDDYWEGD